MITYRKKEVQSYKTVNGETIAQKYLEAYGTSDDTKPTGDAVGNGSVFIEMDTGKVYFFDETNTEWREF